MASSGTKISIPLKAEDVTEDWVLEAMTAFLGREDIEVKKMAASSPEDWYLRGATQAKLRLLKENKSLSVIIKIGLAKDNPSYNYITERNLDAKEIKAFKTDLPRLIEFSKKHVGENSVVAEMIPKIYGADFRNDEERGLYLITEDLSATYALTQATEGDGLALKQLQLCLNRIARFHAVSYAYTKINKKLWPEEDRFHFAKLLEDPSVIEGLEVGLDKAIADFKDLDNNEGKNLAEKLEALKSGGDLKKAFLTSLEYDERFLIHGDYWANNILFHKTQSKIKVYDWAAMGTASPYLDFATIAYMCSKPENLDSWLDKMYDAYFDSMKATCKTFKVPLPFAKEDFVKKCESKGFCNMFCWFMMFYDDMKKLYSLDHILWIGKKTLEHSPDFFNA